MAPLLVLLTLVFAAPVFLLRALIFFPLAGLRSGWKKAAPRYCISLALTAMLLVFELGNFTAFSWARGEYVSAAELRDAAVRGAYDGVYADLEALRADYPGFSPEIRYSNGWNIEFQNSAFDKLVGFTRYQVRLPEGFAILDTSGRFLALEGCDTDPCPAPIQPPQPVFGVIATVQRNEAPFDAVTDYDVHWSDGSTAGIVRLGHCFSALREDSPEVALIISRPGTYPATLQPRFGYFLMGMQLVAETTPPSGIRGVHSQSRISKVDFLNWKSCDPSIRKAWPNQGYWWKR